MRKGIIRMTVGGIFAVLWLLILLNLNTRNKSIGEIITACIIMCHPAIVWLAILISGIRDFCQGKRFDSLPHIKPSRKKLTLAVGILLPSLLCVAFYGILACSESLIERHSPTRIELEIIPNLNYMALAIGVGLIAVYSVLLTKRRYHGLLVAAIALFGYVYFSENVLQLLLILWSALRGNTHIVSEIFSLLPYPMFVFAGVGYLQIAKALYAETPVRKTIRSCSLSCAVLLCTAFLMQYVSYYSLYNNPPASALWIAFLQEYLPQMLLPVIACLVLNQLPLYNQEEKN